jgi:hypothetical protein
MTIFMHIYKTFSAPRNIFVPHCHIRDLSKYLLYRSGSQLDANRDHKFHVSLLSFNIKQNVAKLARVARKEKP